MHHVVNYTVETSESSESFTSHAGLPLLVETLESVVDEELFQRLATSLGISHASTAARHLVSLLCLLASGGEHISDIEQLRADGGLAKLLVRAISSATQLKDFLYHFHQTPDGQPVTEQQDNQWSRQGKAQVRQPGPGLKALEDINDAVWHAAMGDEVADSLTLEVDATIAESDSKRALKTYKGSHGYQPVMAYVPEKKVWVYDEFRDGNVPSSFEMERVVREAVDKVRPYTEKLRFRADSACYNDKVMSYLDGEAIEFVISAVMSQPLRAAILDLPESAWRQVHGGETSGRKSHSTKQKDNEAESRPVLEWAEVDFVPDAPRNRKKHGKPFRYIVVRRPRNAPPHPSALVQLPLFFERDDSFEADSFRYFVRVTNTNWSGARVIAWLNLKQGNIEPGHDSVKNGWAGAHLPFSRFGANAAWWRINILLDNLVTLLKLRALPTGLTAAKPKTLRFLIFNVAARVVAHARRLVLRLDSRLFLAGVLADARAALRTLAQAPAPT